MVRVGISYAVSRVSQIKQEKSLEDFLINRFGRELYLTFFKSYTEKVWGTPCDEISAEWGAQRIKGLCLTTALKHFVRKTFGRRPHGSEKDLAQKGTDTSLIERFMYPKFGPGSSGSTSPTSDSRRAARSTWDGSSSASSWRESASSRSRQ